MVDPTKTVHNDNFLACHLDHMHVQAMEIPMLSCRLEDDDDDDDDNTTTTIRRDTQAPLI